jgi:hypothetical protein
MTKQVKYKVVDESIELFLMEIDMIKWSSRTVCSNEEFNDKYLNNKQLN